MKKDMTSDPSPVLTQNCDDNNDHQIKEQREEEGGKKAEGGPRLKSLNPP
jgi:hypothetical protein